MKDVSWAACLRLGVTAAAVYMICAGRETLAALIDTVSPLLLGGGVACMVNMPMSALERRFFPRGGRMARTVCLTAAMAGSIALTAWFAGVIVPEMVQCAALLAGEMPELLRTVVRWLEDSGAAVWLRRAGLPDWQTLLQRGLSLALTGADEALRSAAGALTTLTSAAANAALALVLAVYMLAGKERLLGQVSRLMRRACGERACQCGGAAAKALYTALCTYVKGQCIEALLLGVLCLIGMTALRLPQALMISALAGVSAFVPLVGTVAAACAGAVLLLPGGAADALTFTVFFLLLQQAESSFICPHIVGASLGLSPVWMLTAMIAGGGLFGLPGAVLAVPVLAAARTLLMEENTP